MSKEESNDVVGTVLVELDDGTIVEATAPFTSAAGVSELVLTFRTPLDEGRQVRTILGSADPASGLRRRADCFRTVADSLAGWLSQWGSWDYGPDETTGLDPTPHHLLMWLVRTHLIGQPFSFVSLVQDDDDKVLFAVTVTVSENEF